MTLLLLLGGCGVAAVGDGSGDAPDVDGRVFLSTVVTREGHPHELVEGSRVRISFEDGRLSVQAGCNTLFGPYRLEGDVLRVNAMGGTRMGCPAELMAQDDWLVEVIEAGPAVAVDGDTLTLTGKDSVLTFLDREVADPDRPLVGTVWRVDALVSGDTTSSVPGRAVATLTLGDDGTLELRGSCNQGGGTYQLHDGDRTLLLETVEMTAQSCGEELDDFESAVLEVLRTGELTVDVTAETLTLTAGNQGLVLREL